jgi:hypothetical protein
MSQTVRLTVGALECVVKGHKISDVDEDLLHNSEEFDTVCERCHYPLHVEDDPSDTRTYYITER